MKFGFYSQLDDSNHTVEYAELLDELREQVVLCEEGGFDIAWADEHHFNYGFTNNPNPLLVGAMMAQATSRIRIGLPCPLPNWNPLRLPEDVAILDHLSRGRVELAMGRGISPFDVANLNPELKGVWPDPKLRFDQSTQTASREHFAEFVEVLKQAWTEDYFSHKGRYFEFPTPGFPWQAATPPPDTSMVKDGEIVKLTVGPKPYQKPYPPLRMLMTSQPSYAEAARLGLSGWVWIGGPPKRMRQRLEVYSTIRSEQEGREFRVGEDVGGLRYAYVAATYEEAKKDVDRMYTTGMRRACLRRPAEYYVDEGEPEPVESDLDFDFFTDRKLILAGSPEDVVEQIHELDETCGLDFIGLWTQAGGLSHKKIMTSLDLFASKVAPRFSNSSD
jgi:alkanesulfonate monooxygenase SsuD/methylene tetrahydromethanopterin reductase-like flavin-dependent oxidoreductase (luciferase family)